MSSKSKKNYSKDSKKGKGKKPAGDMSDFASADDYEDQMEDIVSRYSGNSSKVDVDDKLLKRKSNSMTETKKNSKIVSKAKKIRKN